MRFRLVVGMWRICGICGGLVRVVRGRMIFLSGRSRGRGRLPRWGVGKLRLCRGFG